MLLLHLEAIRAGWTIAVPTPSSLAFQCIDDIHGGDGLCYEMIVGYL